MGSRVGLIYFSSAAVPLNFIRVQNFVAERPRGRPSASSEARMHRKRPHTVRIRRRAALSLPLLSRYLMLIPNDRSL